MKTGEIKTVTKPRLKSKPEDPELKKEVWDWINNTGSKTFERDLI